MRQRLDAGEMRQAQEFIKALRQAEMGEPLAQAKPAAVRLHLACQGRHQRRRIEFDREWDFDVNAWQGRWYRRGRNGRRRWRLLGRASRHFALGRCLRLDLGARRGASLWKAPFVQHAIELAHQPRQALGAAWKGIDGGPPASQTVTPQHRPCRIALVLLFERQRVQEMFGRCHRALGKSLQEDQRPLGPFIE